MAVVHHAVDVQLHGIVLELEVIIDRDDLRNFRVAAQRIREQLRGARGDFFHVFDVLAVGDDGQSFRHGSPQAAGVVDVMVRHDDLRDRLARHGGARLFNDCEAVGLAAVGFEQHQVIVKLE